MKEQRVVLITGASSGIGLATASLLREQGYRVFGTSRKPDMTKAYPFEMVPLDVRSDDSVAVCTQTVLEQTGSIDVLINNAGYGLLGAIEETSIDEAKAIFETDFFGVMRMVNAVLPHMRQRQQGQIINMGVILGFIAQPFGAFLSASKHALEGYTEALRYEVSQFGVKVSIIESDFVNTGAREALHIATSSVEAYDQVRQGVIANFKRSIRTGASPERVAKIVLLIVESKTIRLRYRVGTRVTLIPLLKALSPEPLFESLLRRQFQLNSSK